MTKQPRKIYTLSAVAKEVGLAPATLQWYLSQKDYRKLAEWGWFGSKNHRYFYRKSDPIMLVE